MRTRALLLLVSLFAATPVAAQQAVDRSTPAALATSVNRAVAAKNWDAFVALIDPNELTRVHQTFVRLLEMAPDPSALALFDVPDLESFRALPPKQVMLTFLDIAQVKQQLEGIVFVDMRVVGVVEEAPDLAHAIVRQTMRFPQLSDAELSAADIISMRRRGDSWWVQMGPELEGMLLGLEAGMAAETE